MLARADVLWSTRHLWDARTASGVYMHGGDIAAHH